ncbi:MAG: malto-oligosyltrehalose trehalohydrolase [Candidatus Acidiferrales bacterium]
MEKVGVTPLSNNRYRFVAWGPRLSTLSLILYEKDRRVIPMGCDRCGFYSAEVHAIPGTQYRYRLPDGRELPDPASRFQPDGVHGASAVINTDALPWTDHQFEAPSLSEMIIYELHVGTFTNEGTFAAAITHLSTLVDLGITAIEVMPIGQFPGTRNWGYDGTYPFAVQNSYGGPAGFQQFVDAAHSHGISVILDVVYNHLGPEGNYLGAFGPFFTNRYHTPWGEAINFDEAYSAPVREFFIQNALYWLEEFHIDGLRLDAVHGIFDFGAHHFLAELQERAQDLSTRIGKKHYVVAESDLNDVRLLHAPALGGYGLDAQWSDDFHHSVRTLLTGEKSGYYADFGSIDDLDAVLREGWCYSGQYSRYRHRKHGNSPRGIAPERFVVFTQNHDQVGNRADGDRLSQLLDCESLALAAGITLLSPFVPLLFMGEEYGETHPFQYFTSHSDAPLIEAVRKGRREEFASFGWQGDVPDPQDERTFKRSTLDFTVRDREPHHTLRNLYKSLIGIRKRFVIGGKRPEIRCNRAAKTLMVDYREQGPPLLAYFHFGDKAAQIELPSGSFQLLLRSYQAAIEDPPSAREGQPMSGIFTIGRRSLAVFEPVRSGEEL